MRGRGIAVLAVLGVLMATAVLAGCGGGGDSTTSATAEATAPLSKAQFVKQADKICQQGLKKKDEAVSVALENFAEQAEGAPTGQDTAKIVSEAVLPSYSKTVDELSQLEAPKADTAKVEKLMGEFEAAVKVVETAPAKALQSNPFESADNAAEAYGIEECRL